MKLLRQKTLLVLLLLCAAPCFSAEVYEPFEVELPSEELKDDLLASQGNQPILRQAPDEEGWAQKEVGVGDASLAIYFSLFLFLSTYGLIQRRKIKSNHEKEIKL